MDKKLLKQALDKWGLDFQLLMLQEECAELIKAISHYKRRKGYSFFRLLEEMIDVEIMLAQIKLALLTGTDKNEWIRIKRYKIKKLRKLIENE